jgi:hypothetical protein
VANDTHRTHTGNKPNRIDSFARKVSRDRISQQLHAPPFDPVEQAQRCCHSILLGSDALELRLARGAVARR